VVLNKWLSFETEVMGNLWDQIRGNNLGQNNENHVGLNKWLSFETEVMGIMWD
jgi:hypothetical protein